MAKSVGGGTLTKTKAAAKPVKKLSKKATATATTTAKSVKMLSKKAVTAATTKPAKRLSKAEKRKAEHMEFIAKLIEEKKSGKRLSKAGEWMIAHPNGIGKILI